MQLTVRTNKGVKQINPPDCWEKLTVQQYQRLFSDWDGENHITLFSILSGLPITHIQNSNDGELEWTLLNSVRFIYEQDFKFSTDIPKFLKVRGIDVELPANPGRMSIGQNIQARIAIAERATKDLRQAMSIVVAIYLQPFVLGNTRKNEHEFVFDYDKALELEQEILQMPIVLIHPVGFFLLMQLNKIGKGPQSVLRNGIASLIFNAGKLLNKRGLKR